MTILQMVKDACDELTLTRPSVVLASTDPQTLQLLRLAQNEGRSLSKRHDWQNITSEHTFSTVTEAAQTSSIPADFSRLIPETMFNRTLARRIWGPVDPQEWQETQATVTTQVDPSFRIRGGSILITPTPTASQSVYYEYISTKWCQSSGGTAQTAWTADADTGKLDEYLMTLGIVWRFRAAKGLEFSTAMASYEREVADAIIRDGSRPRLHMGGGEVERIPHAPTTPETLVF